MELQSEEPPTTAVEIQSETLKAWAYGPDGLNFGRARTSPNYASALVVGSDVEGIAFFDNKLDESHVALARCRPQQWEENCWLEFHWFDPCASL